MSIIFTHISPALRSDSYRPCNKRNAQASKSKNSRLPIGVFSSFWAENRIPLSFQSSPTHRFWADFNALYTVRKVKPFSTSCSLSWHSQASGDKCIVEYARGCENTFIKKALFFRPRLSQGRQSFASLRLLCAPRFVLIAQIVLGPRSPRESA